ncbi:podoplanin isoform X2 [Nycticebus coucang]|uniref:podoplanin isoform X2 n=1 Tax=Nycticebus coucang TaxID=9470 RepID=UPI00234D1A03|nr:podoplanin isoform X2 [Nycticebus coucang]
MWKVPVLLLVLGSTSFWAPAKGVTRWPEDDITTPGTEDGLVTRVEDMSTPAATEELAKSPGFTTLVATGAVSVTDLHVEDLSTLESTVHTKESQSTPVPKEMTSHSVEKVGGETQTTIEKDGLTTVTLVGIIVGVLLAIGFLGGIIIVIMRKMSGRYSP